MQPSEQPFTELPAALVEEMLLRSDEVGQQLLTSLESLRSSREDYRRQLEQSGILAIDNELPVVETPTTCGVDGSYAVERLLSTDLAAAAAVAVEGITPPSETRYWEAPHHKVIVEAEPHQMETNSALRGVTMSMELELAEQAPHDVVFIDNSLTTPAIYLNQAFSSAGDAPDLAVSNQLRQSAESALRSYQRILSSNRSDHAWVGAPKYTSNREIGFQLNWPREYDDRGLLTLIMRAGEYTRPRQLQPPKAPWHIGVESLGKSNQAQLRSLADQVTSRISDIHVMYYRPNPWMPALRLETCLSVVSNQSQLARLLGAVKHQCGTPGIMEPFPLYLADRMVKNLPRAIPAFRQVATSRVSEQYSGSIDDVFHGLHGYRTEGGP
ncbi:MAG: DNA double-strand break repair nuclease NurA [Chloroflexota bacterium]|nr:DNA double-strand break repair nuclease NurA [Chloroflexota bacterium]MDE2960422.1 DNA double-strand break repair nuclease NurA [Chloroflexota bacterium]